MSLSSVGEGATRRGSIRSSRCRGGLFWQGVIVFNYFGSKSKLVRLYPEPEYDTIIEPFCGSARYALWYYNRNVILCDADPRICRIWKWLIKDATVADIQSLPELVQGESRKRHKYLSIEEQWLLSLLVNRGHASIGQCETMTEWSYDQGDGNIPRFKRFAIRMLPRIRHWKIFNTLYQKLRINPCATWFIDPPYNYAAGDSYRYGQSAIDYARLAKWVRSRRGQVIVCEHPQATWLPFTPLKTRQMGIKGTLKEAMFTEDYGCKR